MVPIVTKEAVDAKGPKVSGVANATKDSAVITAFETIEPPVQQKQGRSLLLLPLDTKY